MLSKKALIFAAAVLFASIAFAQPNFKLKQVLATGQAAPVPSQLSFVSSFSLNDAGSVAFAADGGILLKSAGNLSIVAGFGDAMPGGGTFLEGGNPWLTSTGDVVFRGVTTGTSGLFRYSGGSVSRLVSDGSVASSGDLVFPDEPSANAAGNVVFVDILGNGLFLFSQGGIRKLVGLGDPAPGGDIFSSFSSPTINQSGEVVFSASLASGNSGIYLLSGGNVSKVIASGDTFPDGAIFFGTFGNPSLNDAGDIAFAGSSDFVSDSGVFLFSNGNLSVVVPAFTPLPSGLDLFPVSASVGNGGQIVFTAQRLDQGGSTGVFVVSQGNLTEVMTPGTASPDGDTFTSAFAASINSSGQVAFATRLLQQNDAIYLSSDGNTVRIAGQGDALARQPKFVFPFAFGFSDIGQMLVFDQTFPGGTGLFNVSSDPGPLNVTLDANVGQRFGNDGVIQGFFENFTMNAVGQVVFNSNLSDGSGGIFLKSTQNLSRLVRASFDGSGDPAPGGGTFQGVRELSISDSGANIAFSAFATSSAGVYVASGGQISLAVNGNDLVPGGAGIFGTVSLNAINDQGEIAFLAQSFPFPNGMYVGANGQFTLLARDGDPAPGGGNFSLLFPDPRYGPVINNNGEVAFAADLSTGGRGVFLYHQGTLTRIAGPGDASPDGSTFFSADAPTINALGQVAFSGETFTHGFGAFLFSAGIVQNVAIAGDRLPRNVTVTFADMPQVNDLGEVAVGVGLSNGENAVLVARPLTEQDDDGAVLARDTNATLLTSPVSRNWMKARHPRNFSFEQRQQAQHK
ncbi:MAG TPA: choice-of-anchor tandem repeat NxxGxxAF-containing protein [Candidatus Angelobacter sp.]|nr:choice-of-anchor tandem repeat NxxGxxAF-containing protein [Candidatus Angelobacter sp.]